jgi:hypothetical protein
VATFPVPCLKAQFLWFGFAKVKLGKSIICRGDFAALLLNTES